MHGGTIESVLLVHGYSVRTLNSWGQLPQLLQANGLAREAIFLSAFVSLDDYVTCNDLAVALEHQIAVLERRGLDLGKTAIICHSTGALVARRWLLDRRKAGEGKTPSHLITAAGANHGSTLAQLGRIELAPSSGTSPKDRCRKTRPRRSRLRQRVRAHHEPRMARCVERRCRAAYGKTPTASAWAARIMAATGKISWSGSRANRAPTAPCGSAAPT